MNTAKIFDIHDENVTPEIYILLFCNAYVEIRQNDAWYEISPFGNEYSDEWQSDDDAEKCFADDIKDGYHNCYYDKEKMKQFCENPCTCAEAVKKFKNWLAEQGVTKDDRLLVTIWW